MAKYFPDRPDLNSVNKHFIIWALNTIHEHSENKFGQKTFKFTQMLFVFPFLIVNNLDVKKRRNPLKTHHTEQFVFLTGAWEFFRPFSC